MFIYLICYTRWGILDIASGTGNKPYSDVTIMHAAGYLEGALTGKYVQYTLEL